MHCLSARLTLACAVVLSAFSAQAQTASTLEKIQQQGKVVIGVRESSAPMAYALGSNQTFIGYHVELCEKVLAQFICSTLKPPTPRSVSMGMVAPRATMS